MLDPNPHSLMRLIFLCLLMVPTVGPIDARGQESERYGALQYRRLIDDITDADRSIVYTAEVRAVLARTGALVERVGRVVWRCDGVEVEVFLRADRLPSDSASVRWRIDDHEPSPIEIWRAGTSGRSLFAPGESAHRLTLQAKGASRFVVRVFYPDGRDLDYVHDISGSRAAIGSLACDPTHRPGASTHSASGTTHSVGGWYRPDRTNEVPWASAPAGYSLPAQY